VALCDGKRRLRVGDLHEFFYFVAQRSVAG
jgi:hypothetical protein